MPDATPPRLALALHHFADEPGFLFLRADEFGGFHSINFVVRSYGFQQDGIAALVLLKLYDDAQIVAATARPRTGKFAFELVGLELRMKRIFRQQFERQLEFRRELRMLSGKAVGGTKERCGRQEQPFHARTLRMISAGLAGRSLPDLNSFRAS